MPRRRLAMASDTGKSKHFLQQEGADEHHEIAWQIEVSPACDGMYLSDQLCSPRARALANNESLLQSCACFCCPLMAIEIRCAFVFISG